MRILLVIVRLTEIELVIFLTPRRQKQKIFFKAPLRAKFNAIEAKRISLSRVVN